MVIEITPRTGHRVATALETAGFQIINTLVCVHGQGFAFGSRDLAAKLASLGAPLELVKESQGWRTQLRPAAEFIYVARNPSPRQSLAQTVLDGGVGGFNIDETRTPTTDNRARQHGQYNETSYYRIDRGDGTPTRTPHEARGT